MTSRTLNNEIITISPNNILRVAILDGDISINSVKDLPKNNILYYNSVTCVEGKGLIKYEGGIVCQ